MRRVWGLCEGNGRKGEIGNLDWLYIEGKKREIVCFRFLKNKINNLNKYINIFLQHRDTTIRKECVSFKSDSPSLVMRTYMVEKTDTHMFSFDFHMCTVTHEVRFLIY